MKTIKAYKVVRKGPNGSFLSAIGGVYASTTYKLGKTTTPPINDNPFLFVFLTRKDARNFRHNRLCPENYAIFVGRAVSDSLFRARTIEGQFINTLNYPSGTAFCKSFTPTCRVW